jgi:hypothetical protein
MISIFKISRRQKNMTNINFVTAKKIEAMNKYHKNKHIYNFCGPFLFDTKQIEKIKKKLIFIQKRKVK